MSLPCEIHITVAGGDVDKFKSACTEAGVKPILLDLHTKGGTFSDLQTSSILKAVSWGNVLKEIARISEVLKKHGFEIVREKVEAPPFHSMAPTSENGKYMPLGSYFETHIAVTTRTSRLVELQEIARKYKAHLSRNIFKQILGGWAIIMVTLREHTEPYETFLYLKDKLEAELAAHGFGVAKSVVEFAIYDTNVKHDEAWMSATA